MLPSSGADVYMPVFEPEDILIIQCEVKMLLTVIHFIIVKQVIVSDCQ